MKTDPDPSRLDAWRQLAEGAHGDLVDAAEEVVARGITPAGVSALRSRFPEAPVVEALELAEARTRAAGKFPRPDAMLMDRAGLEQATALEVSVWKAARFQDRPVLDLCSGIGGDAMGLAGRGRCVAVDRDPVRALMAGHNAEVETRVVAVEDCEIDLPLVHLDPARRDEASGRRSWRIQDLQPGIESIRSILGRVEGGAVKLGPGCPTQEIRLHSRQSISVVAHHDRLVQAIVWTGALAGPMEVEAVDLPSGALYAGTPRPLEVRGDGVAVDQVLVEFHPAVERLGLSGTLLEDHRDVVDWSEPAAGLGLVSGPAPSARVPAELGRWCRIHRVCAVGPARIGDVVRMVAAIPDGGGRRVVVRTRDRAVDADAWTRALNPEGVSERRAAIQVFGLRMGRRKVAIACLNEDEDSA